jgi:prefoldin subunit 5
MTYKKIQWDKLDEAIEKSKEIVIATEREKEISKSIEELNNKVNSLNKERKEITEKYYNYNKTVQSSDLLEDFGILTVIGTVRSDDNGFFKEEAHILSVTSEKLRFRYYYNYGQYAQIAEVELKELKEKGYVKFKGDYSTELYIVDSINDCKVIEEIIIKKLKVELGQKINSLSYNKKELEEHNKKIKELEKSIEEYKQVSDTKIGRLFNNLSFGVTEVTKDEFLASLPRKICIYKEKEVNE